MAIRDFGVVIRAKWEKVVSPRARAEAVPPPGQALDFLYESERLRDHPPTVGDGSRA